MQANRTGGCRTRSRAWGAAVAALAFALASGTALAETPGETVAAFYDALREADADRLGTVLAEDAVIRLADLGFDMTREEFLESMETWSEVTTGMTMRVRPDPDAADTDETVVRIVCYEFPSNASMTRETSTVVDGRITANMQDEIAEACEGF